MWAVGAVANPNPVSCPVVTVGVTAGVKRTEKAGFGVSFDPPRGKVWAPDDEFDATIVADA